MTIGALIRDTQIDIVSFDETGLTVESTRTLSSGDDGVSRAVDRSWFAPGGDKLFFNGALGNPRRMAVAKIPSATIIEVTNFSGDNQFSDWRGAAFTPDGERMLSGHQGTNGGSNLRLWDITGFVPSLLDGIVVSSGSSTVNDIAWIGGTRFVHAPGGGGKQVLVDIANDTLTEIAVGGILDDSGGAAQRIGAAGFNRIIASGANVNLAGERDFIAVDLSSDDFVQASNVVKLDTSPNPSQIVNGRSFVSGGIVELSGDTLAVVRRITAKTMTPAIAKDGLSALYAMSTAEGRTSTVYLEGISAQITSVSRPSTILGISSEYSTPVTNPPSTPEEIFSASYARASAAPPKVTALIRPQDVQRSIDTDVNNLASNPRFYTVNLNLDVGELSNLRHDKIWFVRANQPGLRAGKYLRLKAYTINSGDPSVPVTCVFWG